MLDEIKKDFWWKSRHKVRHKLVDTSTVLRCNFDGNIDKSIVDIDIETNFVGIYVNWDAVKIKMLRLK